MVGLTCAIGKGCNGDMPCELFQGRGVLVHAARYDALYQACIGEQTWDDVLPCLILEAFHLQLSCKLWVGVHQNLGFHFGSQFWLSDFWVKCAGPDVFNYLTPLFLQCTYGSNYTSCKNNDRIQLCISFSQVSSFQCEICDRKTNR